MLEKPYQHEMPDKFQIRKEPDKNCKVCSGTGNSKPDCYCGDVHACTCTEMTPSEMIMFNAERNTSKDKKEYPPLQAILDYLDALGLIPEE